LKDALGGQLSRSNGAAVRKAVALPVERLSGRGMVTTKRGKQISVEYHLCIMPGSDTQAGAAAEAGLPGFSGQVWCPYDGSFVSVYQGKIMTLCIEDGRKLRFFHQDRDGAIAVTEWLG
jgi:hypothetical protein